MKLYRDISDMSLRLCEKVPIFPPFASPFEVQKSIFFLCIEDIDSRNVLKVDTDIKCIFWKLSRTRDLASEFANK